MVVLRFYAASLSRGLQYRHIKLSWVARCRRRPRIHIEPGPVLLSMHQAIVTRISS